MTVSLDYCNYEKVLTYNPCESAPGLGGAAAGIGLSGLTYVAGLQDALHDGVGRAFLGHRELICLGQAADSVEHEAWVLLAGSIPGLVLNMLSVSGGMLIKSRYPALGSAMAAFGLTNHAISSISPISVALMSSGGLQDAALRGNDFANFAIQASHTLNVSAELVAISTAAVWTLIVPLVAGIAYLYTKSQAADIVTDVQALQHWRSKNDEEYQRYLADYREEEGSANAVPDSYLLKKLSPKTLAACKMEVVASWEAKLPRDRVQVALLAASVVGFVSAISAKILGVLSATVAPVLDTAAMVMGCVSLVFVAAPVLSSAYQVYKDFQCDDSTVPKLAKALSVARLVTSIACAVLLGVSLFVPGMNMLFLVRLLVGSVISILFIYARAQVIRRQYINAPLIHRNAFSNPLV